MILFQNRLRVSLVALCAGLIFGPGARAQQEVAPGLIVQQPQPQSPRQGRRNRQRSTAPNQQNQNNGQSAAPNTRTGRRRGQPARQPTRPVGEFIPGGAISSTPCLGKNGLVYLTSWNGKVYALDANTGAVRWRFTAPKMFNASPALGADGTLYACAYDGKVYALNGATGAQKWTFQTRNLINSAAAVSMAGDMVYVGGYDHTIYGLAAGSGAVRWRYAVGAAASSPQVGQDGTVYVGADKIYALNGTDGTKKWEFATGFDAESPVALGPDGTVYAQAHDAAGQSQLCALNAQNGHSKWIFPLTQRLAYPPTVSGERVWVGADRIYALRETTGRPVWQYSGASARWSSPTVHNDILCAGSGSGTLVALDAVTGLARWTFSTNDAVLSFPSIGANGKIYVACEGDRKVYALDSRSGKTVWQFVQDPLPTPPVRSAAPAQRTKNR